MFEDSLEVFDSSAWNLLYQSSGHVSDFALSPDGQHVALAGQDITILDTAGFDVEYTIPLPSENIYWSPDGGWLVHYQDDRHILFDKDKAYVSLGPLSWMVFIDNQHVLAFGDNRVMAVDLVAGKVTGGARIGLDVSQLTWSQNGDALMLTTPDGDWYWAEATGQVGTTPPVNESFIPATQVSKRTAINKITTVSPDGSFQAVATLTEGCGVVPDGGACSISAGVLEIFERYRATPFKTLDFSESGPASFAWSADSSLLAVGLGSAADTVQDDRIIVIDVRTGDELFSFEGHLGDVTGLVFSPNGMRLASASEDGTVIVWNTGH
ncbi:MAG: hypothetical protein JXB07_08355 [Anaerolineae bacterium]|nr:hypothetical protein [Anaerolineae bacterium]